MHQHTYIVCTNINDEKLAGLKLGTAVNLQMNYLVEENVANSSRV